MRTTINLEPEAYELIRALAAKSHRSLGEVVSEAILSRYRASTPSESSFYVDELGLPVFRSGKPVTSEDVAEAIEED